MSRLTRLAVLLSTLLTAALALAVAVAGSADAAPSRPTRTSPTRTEQIGNAVLLQASTPKVTTPKVTTRAATSTVTAGLLAPSTAQLQSLVGSKVTRVVIPIGWNAVEPQQNVYNTDALAQFKSEITTLNGYGFQVVLDLGLQYPPSWVFSLPGATRFVNQYGDVWQGSTGEDVANAVFDTSVRSAEAGYIQQLAKSLGSSAFAAVRVGGLLSGELRYPDAVDNGHTDSIWDYDSAAQAGAPYKGWKPGTGTAAQARASVQYYFNSLTGYETWLMKTVNGAFPGVNQQVMLPGWGMRPGMLDDAVNTGMTNNSIAEVNGMIASGLDWANQVKAISTAGVNGTVYTTWLDAQTQANTVQGEAPVDYLASLAAQYHLPLSGENAGGGGTAALALCVQRVQADHLTSFMYMAGPMIDDGSAGIALSDLTSAAASIAS